MLSNLHVAATNSLKSSDPLEFMSKNSKILSTFSSTTLP